MSNNEMMQTLHPDPSKQGTRVTKATYEIYKAALLQVIPTTGEGMAFTALGDAIIPHSPSAQSDSGQYVARLVDHRRQTRFGGTRSARAAKLSRMTTCQTCLNAILSLSYGSTVTEGSPVQSSGKVCLVDQIAGFTLSGRWTGDPLSFR